MQMLKASSRCAPSFGSARRQFATPKPSTTAMSAVKLYTNPGSRGKMPEWYLAELGTPFEAVNLNMQKKEHKAPAYLAVHPFGSVPAMTDGDINIFESGAILLHLAHKYGRVSGDALSLACTWVIYANATMSDAFFGSNKAAATPPILNTLDALLGKSTYISGEEFTVCDIAIGGYLLYLPMFFPNENYTKYKNVWAYMKRIVARPTCPASYQAAMQGK